MGNELTKEDLENRLRQKQAKDDYKNAISKQQAPPSFTQIFFGGGVGAFLGALAPGRLRVPGTVIGNQLGLVMQYYHFGDHQPLYDLMMEGKNAEERDLYRMPYLNEMAKNMKPVKKEY